MQKPLNGGAWCGYSYRETQETLYKICGAMAVASDILVMKIIIVII